MTKQSGFLLINKPTGPTSHDIIDGLRKITGVKKIGHAGTLDPFACGLLIVGVGREATREISKFVGMDKWYVATLKLGYTSDTFDRDGEIQKNKKTKKQNDVNIHEVEVVLRSFVGEQEQVPPMYSAKKVGGKKLYELARKGLEVKREPQKIEIFKIKLIEYKYPYLKIEVCCSSGTYVRTLAHDIGQKLGAGAYLEELCRTLIGKYKLEEAYELNELTRDNFWKFFITF